jgi:hypothetical protein
MSPAACHDHSTQKNAHLQNQFPFLSTVSTVASVRCFFEFLKLSLDTAMQPFPFLG